MDNLQTGDIILFSGKCNVSKAIKLLTWSKYSHVGMVINDDPNYDFPLLYESTHNDSIKGLDIGKHTQGVQVVPLKDRIEQYQGTVAIRRVINPCYRFRHQLRLYRTEMKGVPFEQSTIELLSSTQLFACFRGKGDLTSVFCSEHQAESFMALGWMCRCRPSNYFTPKFFAVNNTYLNLSLIHI